MQMESAQQDTKNTQNVVNIEYLKSCIYRYMVTTEISEQVRIVPVISTLLQFTVKEKELIAKKLQEEEESLFNLSSNKSGGSKLNDSTLTSLYKNVWSLTGSSSTTSKT